MTVKDITKAWIKDQRAAFGRAKTIKSLMDNAIGKEEFDTDVLTRRAIDDLAKLPVRKVIRALASDESLAIRALFSIIEDGDVESKDDEGNGQPIPDWPIHLAGKFKSPYND